MQNPDKINQLKKSIQARQEAEAKQQAHETSGHAQEISAGMKAKYEEKIQQLEEALNQTQTKLEAAEKKSTEAHDQFVRKHAEFENFRKRMEREKLEAGKYGQEKLAQELLPIIDSLEKAIEHAEEETQSESDTNKGASRSAPTKQNNTALLEGVQLVEKQFLQVLEKFGIRPIPAVGETFNPHVHEAVGHLESAEYPPNTVMEEYRRGYTYHDRVLRAAMVAVAKAPEA